MSQPVVNDEMLCIHAWNCGSVLIKSLSQKITNGILIPNCNVLCKSVTAKLVRSNICNTKQQKHAKPRVLPWVSTQSLDQYSQTNQFVVETKWNNKIILSNSKFIEAKMMGAKWWQHASDLFPQNIIHCLFYTKSVSKNCIFRNG